MAFTAEGQFAGAFPSPGVQGEIPLTERYWG
jgi:hypothetical protein